jgi:hypothetical protein
MAGGHYADQGAPARKWKVVTPSDTVDLPSGCRGLWVGTAGTLSIVDAEGSTVSLTIPEAGRLLPLGPVRVNSTGTSATEIVALY